MAALTRIKRERLASCSLVEGVRTYGPHRKLWLRSQALTALNVLNKPPGQLTVEVLQGTSVWAPLMKNLITLAIMMANIAPML